MSRILSGIRPSGDLHLGNYLGAIKQWIALQSRHEVFYMVADLHAITTPYKPEELEKLTRETVIEFLAAGLDPAKAPIFVQSDIPAHCELMWLLNTITPLGELQRMIQFKEKSVQHKDSQNAGILNYPILQAADILIYKADEVPVGEDQAQHVELARDLAKKFNRTFGEVFPEPKARLTVGKKIMDLANPEQKMSKSTGGGVALTDDEDVIREKLQKAVTTSEPRVIREAFKSASTGAGEWKGDPKLAKQFLGVRNLFTILLALGDKSDIEIWRAAAEAGEIQFSEFKPALAAVIAGHFAPFRKRRAELLKDPAYVKDVIKDGAKRASLVAGKTLSEARQKMGLK